MRAAYAVLAVWWLGPLSAGAVIDLAQPGQASASANDASAAAKSIAGIPSSGAVSAGSSDGSTASISYQLSDTSLRFSSRQLVSGAIGSAAESDGALYFVPREDFHWELSGFEYASGAPLWTSEPPTGKAVASISGLFQIQGVGPAPFDVDLSSPGSFTLDGPAAGTFRSGITYPFSFYERLSGVQAGSAGQAAGQVSMSLELLGDTNNDSSVGFDDLVTMARHYGASGADATYANGDFNLDGNVGFDDLVILGRRYGESLPTVAATVESLPEPGMVLPATVLLMLSACRTRRRTGDRGC